VKSKQSVPRPNNEPRAQRRSTTQNLAVLTWIPAWPMWMEMTSRMVAGDEELKKLEVKARVKTRMRPRGWVRKA
jgi:hypothetical protein